MFRTNIFLLLLKWYTIIKQWFCVYNYKSGITIFAWPLSSRKFRELDHQKTKPGTQICSLHKRIEWEAYRYLPLGKVKKIHFNILNSGWMYLLSIIIKILKQISKFTATFWEKQRTRVMLRLTLNLINCGQWNGHPNVLITLLFSSNWGLT